MKYYLLFLMLILLPGCLAVNISEEAVQINESINLAEKVMGEISEKKLPTTRYNDTLLSAKQLYDAQLSLESAGGKPDYTQIKDKIAEMQQLKLDIIKTKDELKALAFALNESEGVNMTAALKMYQEAEAEFQAERYEKSLELIDKTYQKMSELEAIDAKLKAFYDATSKGIASFFWNNSGKIALLIITLILTYLLFNKKITCLYKERKMNQLEARRESIKRLIAETQKEYFEKGKMDERTYHIRTKKYAELVRDINRQIPLLEEELAMLRNLKRKVKR